MEQALTHPARPLPGPEVNRLTPQPVDNHSSRGTPSTPRPAAAPAAAGPAPGTHAGVVSPGEQVSGSSSSSLGATGSSAAATTSAIDHGSGVDELQDETPGRSPQHEARSRQAESRQLIERESSLGGSDPLGEGLGLLAGIALALLTLVVPLLSVISDRPPNPADRSESTSSSGQRR
ncbi:MAG: hypothetical protein WAM11_15855 [Cyanobium sp.]